MGSRVRLLCARLLLISVGACWTFPRAGADTIIVDDGRDGIPFTCLIYGEEGRPPREMGDNPERFIEFKAGSMHMQLRRSRVLSWNLDEDYVPPEEGSEAARALEARAMRALAGERTEETTPRIESGSQTLSAEVSYLVNFAETGKRGVATVPLQANGSLAEGQWIETKPNSRATLSIADSIFVGLKERTRIALIALDKNVVGGKTENQVEFRLDSGKIWVDVRLRPGETLDLNVSDFRFKVVRDSLFSFQSEGGGITRKFQITYWRGGGALEVRSQILRSTGFYLDLGQRVIVDRSAESETQEVAPDPAELQEWETWTRFEPVEFQIEPRFVYPLAERLPSKEIDYALREDLGSSIPIPKERMTKDLMEILQDYQKALERFRTDVGRYPTAGEGLSALTDDPGVPGWEGPYIEGELIRDWWDRPLQYGLIGREGDYEGYIYSTGPNRVDEMGLGDDLRR